MLICRLRAACGGLLVVLLGAVSSAVSAAEPAGAAFPTKVTVGQEQLSLNGKGTRVRFVVSVYEAGLYTKRPVRSAEELAKLEGAKRLHAVALREVDAGTLGRLFMKGIAENNPRDDVARLLPAISQISGLFTERRKLKSGDTFGFDHVPGQGTKLVINGAMQGDWVKDPAFFPMVMRMWLGPNPADAELKQALLGLPRTAPPSVEP